MPALVSMLRCGTTLQKILFAIIAALVLCILTVTVIHFVRTPNQTKQDGELDALYKDVKRTSTSITEASDDSNDSNDSGERMWTNIGRLRIPSANTTIIITIAFPYNSLDKALTEELALNNKNFRSIVTDYFKNTNKKNTQTKSVTNSMDEDEVKKDLLSKFNQRLRLGKIKQLYFTEFTVLD